MDIRKLVADCISGSRAAQQELYQLYAPAMMGVCYRYTKSFEDAQDVLQEGFIRVFTHLRKLKGENPEPWIRRIMVNAALTYLEKHRRYRLELDVDDLSLHPVSSEDPSIGMETRDLVDLVRKLPSGYQAVFNLVAVEGYEYDEIAAMTGWNINTIRSRFSRARASLAAMVINMNKENLNRNAG